MTDERRLVGPWLLSEELGEGGNAVVWRATREGNGEAVALKVVKANKAGREPYKRFVREIGFLRSLDDFSGILPVLDAYLPESPASDDRPWLAMPVARPIGGALSGASLEEVVEAMVTIAETLARLAAEHGVAHRDVKPNNLYELEGTYLVGDFGLIDLPDVEELTRSDRPLGPAHYSAYELIQDPVGAEPHPADVYSLGKTLWVLATEQSYPPEGHQPAQTRKYSIADMRGHPNAGVLDQLIDQATRLHPEERPTMAAVAAELRAWQALPTEGPAFDAADAAARIRERLATELAEEDIREQRRELGLSAVRRLQELTAPLNEVLKQARPRAEIDITDDRLTQNMMRTLEHSGSPEIIFRWQRCSRIGTGPDYDRYVVRMGRGVEVTADGDLILHAFVDVGDPDTSRTDYMWEADDRTAAVGTAEAEKLIRELVDELGEKLREGLEAFLANLPEEEGG